MHVSKTASQIFVLLKDMDSQTVLPSYTCTILELVDVIGV